RAFAAVEGNVDDWLAGCGDRPSPCADQTTLEGEGDVNRIFGPFMHGHGAATLQFSHFGVDLFDIAEEVADAVAVVKAAVQRHAAAGHHAVATPGHARGNGLVARGFSWGPGVVMVKG